MLTATSRGVDDAGLTESLGLLIARFVDEVPVPLRSGDAIEVRKLKAWNAVCVSIPVRNQMVEYEEWYEVDPETFDRYTGDPTVAHEFVARARRRELDHLLLFPPGTDRGAPD